MTTVRIDALTSVATATGDKYVIFDASTGDIASTDVIVAMQGASSGSASTVGTVPQASAGNNKRALMADATWREVPQPSSSATSQIMEFGSVRNATGAWNTTGLTLGGLTFTWSQAANNGGSLNFIRASGFTQAALSASQTARKYADSTYSGDTNENLDAFVSTQQTICTGITMSGPYQQIDYEIVLRSVTSTNSGHWSVKVIAEGNSGLVITGTYIGARYS